MGAPYAPGRNVLSLPRKQGFFVAEYPVAEGEKRELVARLDEHRRDDAGADGRSGAAGGAGCSVQGLWPEGRSPVGVAFRVYGPRVEIGRAHV